MLSAPEPTSAGQWGMWCDNGNNCLKRWVSILHPGEKMCIHHLAPECLKCLLHLLPWPLSFLFHVNVWCPRTDLPPFVKLWVFLRYTYTLTKSYSYIQFPSSITYIYVIAPQSTVTAPHAHLCHWYRSRSGCTKTPKTLHQRIGHVAGRYFPLEQPLKQISKYTSN